ncbi:MAG: hypothetical protein IRZ29_04575, partial [Thermoflavifilum sp.]|nr:hypothetical protein [Thermoflavifilum sp.]
MSSFSKIRIRYSQRYFLRTFILVSALSIAQGMKAQSPNKPSGHTDKLLQQLLFHHGDSLFHQVITHPDSYRLQILYVQINRDAHN